MLLCIYHGGQYILPYFHIAPQDSVFFPASCHCGRFEFSSETEFPTRSGGVRRGTDFFFAIEMCVLNSFVSSCLDTVYLLPIEFFCLPCFLCLYPRGLCSE